VADKCALTVNVREIEVKALHVTKLYLSSLKGNMKIFPISLKTISIVKLTILNGSKINQINGKRNNRSMAIGQQATNRRHQRASAINILIVVENVISRLSLGQLCLFS
jgi:hypothetical protein